MLWPRKRIEEQLRKPSGRADRQAWTAKFADRSNRERLSYNPGTINTACGSVWKE